MRKPLVCRYAEANALRAWMVRRAEDWPYSSVRWTAGRGQRQPPVPLVPWPVNRPDDWLACVNEPLSADELVRLRARRDL